MARRGARPWLPGVPMRTATSPSAGDVGLGAGHLAPPRPARQVAHVDICPHGCAVSPSSPVLTRVEGVLEEEGAADVCQAACVHSRGCGPSREGQFTVQVRAFNDVSAVSLAKQLFVVREPCQPPPVKNMGPGKVQVGPGLVVIVAWGTGGGEELWHLELLQRTWRARLGASGAWCLGRGRAHPGPRVPALRGLERLLVQGCLRGSVS